MWEQSFDGVAPSAEGAAGLPSQGAGPGEGEGEFGPVPCGQSELAEYVRSLEEQWHSVMADMVGGDMSSTM